MTRWTNIAVALSLFITTQSFAVVVLDFRDPSPAGPSDATAGETLETGTPFTVGALTVTATPTGNSLFSDGLLANATALGVDSNNTSTPSFTDVPENIQFDGGESLAISFNRDIRILSIDLQGLVGSEVGRVTAGAFSIDLFTGVSGFNGTTDVYTPTDPIFVSLGTDVVFEGIAPGASFGLQGITLELVIPEPTSVALLCLGSLAMLRRRRLN